MKKSMVLVLLVAFTLFAQSLNAQQLWGMTLRGGSNGGGTIYRVNADNGQYLKIVHDFPLEVPGRDPDDRMTLGSNNKFYGITGGPAEETTLYEWEPGTNAFRSLWLFKFPVFEPYGVPILASNGKLYGTTTYGGFNISGTIYSFDLNTNEFKVEFQFTNPDVQGGTPAGQLIEISGKLYGVTYQGGNATGFGGVLFEYDIATKTLVPLYNFGNTSGRRPVGITLGSDGKFYGLTTWSGAHDAGVFFSFDKSTSTYVNIHDFAADDGGGGWRAPISHTNGNIYGVTPGGGPSNSFGADLGVFFEYDVVAHQFTIKSRFGDGTISLNNGPRASLCEGAGGILYLPIQSSISAKILEIAPTTGAPTVKLTLPTSKAYGFFSSLTKGPNNDMYIAYEGGGATGNGTILVYDGNTSAVKKRLTLGTLQQELPLTAVS